MRHTIVVDLGFGDAGKGTVVDWLCASRPVHTVVRFNGGAQAGHNVVLPDGRHHTFAQFGAGTFHGARTLLSRFVVVDPLALAAEAAHLDALGVPAPFELLSIDRAALLATPLHRAANRAREVARGADRHGSCGMGVGEAMAFHLAHPGDAPTVADCARPEVLRRKLCILRDALHAELGPLAAPPVDDCVEAFRAFAKRVSCVDGDALGAALRAGAVVFEGAQGVLLDEWYGFHPYTTWSTTTFANAETLLAEAGFGGAAQRIGVLRTTTVRHGAGPLVTEDAALARPEPHNPTNPWQGAFRVGHFDAVAHRYAIAAAGGVDGLALTHLDAALAGPPVRICTSYEGGPVLDPPAVADLAVQQRLTEALGNTRPAFAPITVASANARVEAVEDALSVPVVLRSFGPTTADKQACDALLREPVGLRAG